MSGPKHGLRRGIFPYGDCFPQIPGTVFLAPGAVIVGDVVMGERCSVWFNAVVRGDVNSIRIGGETNIQDLTMLHVTHETHPLVIGRSVTIGHRVTLHGCTVGDLSLIGMGAVVLDGAVIESGAMVAAGALVTPRTVVPSGTLFGGVPGRVLRDLRPGEIDELPLSAARYVAYARSMVSSLGSY